MTTRLRAVAGGWTGTDGGIAFHFRPTDASKEAGPELVESGRYSLVVSGCPAGSTLHVHGLPHPHYFQQGLLLANFHLGHEFGDLQLQVVCGSHEIARAVIGVGARYLDVATDFAAIHADLERVAHGLAYSIWKQAAQAAFPDFEVPPGTADWLALLRFLRIRISRGLAAIAQDPDQELRDVYEVVPAGRARGLDQRGMRWLSQHPDAWEVFSAPPPVQSISLAQGYAVPVKALSRRREVSLDTPANRLLKARLTRIERRIDRVVAAVNQLSQMHFAAGQKLAYRDQLLKVLRDSQRTTVHGFLRNVSDAPVPAGQSTHVARADPRYRDVLRAAAMLEWGVMQGIGGTTLLMSQRETWELYEYWVYLYLNSIFHNASWRCTMQSTVRLASDASVIIDLAKGSASRMQYESTAAGPVTVISLTFHKVYPSRDTMQGLGLGARTAERDVDIILEVQTSGIIRRAAIDAKYRVDVENDCKVAPLEAIDNMHVYRDSVGRWAAGLAGKRMFEPTLDVAVAVYPSRDETCAAKHRFCRSLDDGVGALPLLPGLPPDVPQLLEKFVRRLAEGFIEAPTQP